MVSASTNHEVEMTFREQDEKDLREEYQKLKDRGINIPIFDHFTSKRDTPFPTLASIFSLVFSMRVDNSKDEYSNLKKDVDYYKNRVIELSRQGDYLQKALDSKKALPDIESEVWFEKKENYKTEVMQKYLQEWSEIIKILLTNYVYESKDDRPERKEKAKLLLEWLKNNKVFIKVDEKDFKELIH